MELSEHRRKLLERIDEYEQKELWHLDVEDNPETYPLEAHEIDYLNEKWTSRRLNALANFLGTAFFDHRIKKRQLIIKEVRGIENYTAVEGGCIVSCNHFSIDDNYAVWVALREYMNGRMLYKVIREGNYTNPPKPFGLIMRHCNTLPLSSRLSTMKKFLAAVRTLLSRGETVLIYPEQGMWCNYRKPRPMQDGAFTLAARFGAPIVPIFITMQDSDVPDGEGQLVQEYTVNILPAIYPDGTLSPHDAAKKMKKENYESWVRAYEDFYGTPLVYAKP